MKLNSVFFALDGYDPPFPSSEFCSSQMLAELLVYDRSFWEVVSGPGWVPPISEQGLRHLVEMVFFASLSPDEGRFLRFNVATLETEGSIFNVARFDPVHLDGPAALCRLAPACTHSECALSVSEREGSLFCDGIVNLGPMGYEWEFGKPQVGGVGQSPMYQITVRDPGHLIMTGSTAASYELRAGRIRRLCPYWALEPVKVANIDFCTYLSSEVTKLAGDDAGTIVGSPEHSRLFILVLSTMLRQAMEARHGGAFIMLPINSLDPAAFDIDLKYRVSDLDLGWDAVTFWSACVHYARSPTRDESLLRQWIVRRTKMLADAEVAGKLSGTDGCVVLNRHLQVCGFGGEIVVSDDQARKAIRPFKNVRSGDEWPYEEFMRGIGGTRHRSAARVCRAHPRVLAFVISQDAELKVLSSSDEQVNAFGPLDLHVLNNAVY